MSIAPRCVLFDLDGTLVDTAPELAEAANRLRATQQLAPLTFEMLRPVCSQGARGLLRRAFGIDIDDAAFPALRDRFLALYGENLCRQSLPFEGIEVLLTAMEARGISWGIVTNKPRAYAEPLVEALGWDQRMAVMVCGDDTAHPKPAPDPLLHAARTLDLSCEEIHYVGDDPRDIVAARAAEMGCTAVAWGYIEDAPDIYSWGADAVCTTISMLNRQLCPTH